MRASTLRLLTLVVACLIGTPAAVHAQADSAVPMQASPAPAATNTPAQPLAWSGLSAAQQRMLAPVRGQWDQLRPARQYRLAERALQWASLPPGHQQRIRERLRRWAAMTPAQRHQLRENARAFHNLTPEQRAKVSEAFRKFQSLPPTERRALRERWRKMTPEERKRWITEHPDQPIPVRPMHPGH
jgi:hypothetical protein